MTGIQLIQQAMYQHLTTSEGPNVSSSLVAWPNYPFTPPASGLWYEVAFLPGQPVAAGIGASAQNRHYGIFQVTVCGVRGIGEGVVVTEAERIVEEYKRGTIIVRTGDAYGLYPSTTLFPGGLVYPSGSTIVGEIKKAWRGPGFVADEPACYQVPVSVQFWADVAN